MYCGVPIASAEAGSALGTARPKSTSTGRPVSSSITMLLGLDVAVDDAGGVDGVDALRDELDDGQGAVDGDGVAVLVVLGEDLPQRATADELHGEEVRALVGAGA